MRMIKNEFHSFFLGRCPEGMILIGAPLIFVLLFGAVYLPNHVEHIPMIVYDEDQSPFSRSLIQAYNDSDTFAVTAYASDQEEWKSRLDSGEILSGISIPKNFSEDVKEGNGSSVLMEVNSSNNVFSSVVLTSASEINRTFGLGAAQKIMEAEGMSSQTALAAVNPVPIGVRILNNPINGYIPFILSGLLLNGLKIGLLLTATPLLIKELKNPRYSSLSSLEVVAGKMIPCWCISLAAYMIAFAVMTTVFPIPCKGSLSEVLCLGAAYSFFVIAVLFLFSVCSPDPVFALQLPLIYIMPGLLFSGITWPVFSMNEFARFFSSMLPLFYAADNFRDIMLGGYAPHLWEGIRSMILAGILTGSGAGIIFSLRRKQHHVHLEHHETGNQTDFCS